MSVKCYFCSMDKGIIKQIAIKMYTRRLTYSEVKYGYLRIVKEYHNQCPNPNENIVINSPKGTVVKRMHSTQIGRIDGMTELYKVNEVETGDEVTIKFNNKEAIDISFNKGKDLLQFRQEKEGGKKLITILDEIRELISKHTYLFCRNEMNVRIEIIEPIFKALGWDLPNLNREKSCHKRTDDKKKPSFGKRADYALYKDGKCVLIIEAKSIEKELDKKYREKLSQDYMCEDSLNTKYGILTNGIIWLVCNQKAEIVKSINIMPKQENNAEIESFFNLFHKDKINELEITEEQEQYEPIDWGQSFKIIERDSLSPIEEGSPTDILVTFVKKHFDQVWELQQNNRFVVPVVSTKRTDFRESQEPEKYEKDGKTYYITKDHNTYLKRFLIQQIIVEAKIDAIIDPKLP